VEESDLTAKETIRFLNRQNTGLTAGEWVVVKESVSKDAKSAYFAALVGDNSLETLKNNGFKPFCRLDWAIIKLLDKERSKDAEKTAQVMTKFV